MTKLNICCIILLLWVSLKCLCHHNVCAALTPRYYPIGEGRGGDVDDDDDNCLRIWVQRLSSASGGRQTSPVPSWTLSHHHYESYFMIIIIIIIMTMISWWRCWFKRTCGRHHQSHPKPYLIIIIEKLAAQYIVDSHITLNCIRTNLSRQKYLSHVLEIPFLNCCHSCQSCHSWDTVNRMVFLTRVAARVKE